MTLDRFYFDAAFDNCNVDLRVATNRDDRKNAGWKSVVRANGTPFRNQDDCIQYVNTGR